MPKEVKQSCVFMKRKVYLSYPILIIFLIFSLNHRSLDALTTSSKAHQDSAEQRLRDFDRQISPFDRWLLKQTSPNQKNALSPAFRDLFEKRQSLIVETQKWRQAVGIQKAILELPASHPIDPEEADAIAQTTIETFEKMKKSFKMIRPAALNNIFVNMKLKNDGLCWHWARELLKTLETLPLKTLSFHWITAHKDKLAEHNAIAVYALGKTFEDGLVLDGWRKGGIPYYNRISQDHYPWKIGEYYEEENQNDQTSK